MGLDSVGSWLWYCFLIYIAAHSWRCFFQIMIYELSHAGPAAWNSMAKHNRAERDIGVFRETAEDTSF